MSPSRCLVFVVAAGLFTCAALPAQSPTIGQAVPRDVEEIYEKGLAFLQRTQTERGTWSAGEGTGPGTTGLAVLAFLASGEDPNFGPYAAMIRRGLRHIISSQSGETGYIGPSMYHHGFATLALAEAYGVVDDAQLFPSGQRPVQRTLGEALELAVRSALTSQRRNRKHAWRYSPNASDADTSVSGAVLMGLLAARNAGIEVPDEAIDQALDYFASMTAGNGTVGYTNADEIGGESIARSSIAHLVLAIAGRDQTPAFRATRQYLLDQLETEPTWPEYARYYQAQALFQSDVQAWQAWNRRLIRKLKADQRPDGSFDGDLSPPNSTSMSLLALAVNFRFLPIYER